MNQKTPVYVLCRPGNYRSSLVATLKSIARIDLRGVFTCEEEVLQCFDLRRTGILVFDGEQEQTSHNPPRLFEQVSPERCIVLVRDEIQQKVTEQAGVHASLVKGFTIDRLVRAIDTLVNESTNTGGPRL